MNNHQPETAACAECGHPKDAHTERGEPVSVCECTACPDGEEWHDYQPAASTAVPPADRAGLRETIADASRATPTVWVDGHPQMEAIAAAVWEQCGRSDNGACVEDDPRNIAVAALGAVLPSAPTRTDTRAETLLRRFTAEAHRRKWDYDRGLDGDGIPIKSETFTALHRLGEDMRAELEKLRRLAVEAGQAGGPSRETTDAPFVPPSADGLPPGALDSASAGASMLDAWGRTPYGLNVLSHALTGLARDGWLRTEPGDGFEPVRDRETQPEPEAQGPDVAWHILTNQRGTWRPWLAPHDDHAEARQDYDRCVSNDGHRWAFRLVRETSTFAVEAEHQPAAEQQDGARL